LERFKKKEFHVTRYHDEFVWLHDRFEEQEVYAGYIVSDIFWNGEGWDASAHAKDPAMPTETRLLAVPRQAREASLW
jgi:hypothetical protein